MPFCLQLFLGQVHNLKLLTLKTSCQKAGSAVFMEKSPKLASCCVSFRNNLFFFWEKTDGLAQVFLFLGQERRSRDCLMESCLRHRCRHMQEPPMGGQPRGGFGIVFICLFILFCSRRVRSGGFEVSGAK